MYLTLRYLRKLLQLLLLEISPNVQIGLFFFFFTIKRVKNGDVWTCLLLQLFCFGAGE